MDGLRLGSPASRGQDLCAGVLVYMAQCGLAAQLLPYKSAASTPSPFLHIVAHELGLRSGRLGGTGHSTQQRGYIVGYKAVDAATLPFRPETVKKHDGGYASRIKFQNQSIESKLLAFVVALVHAKSADRTNGRKQDQTGSHTQPYGLLSLQAAPCALRPGQTNLVSLATFMDRMRESPISPSGELRGCLSGGCHISVSNLRSHWRSAPRSLFAPLCYD